MRVEPVLAEAAPRASLEFTEHLTGFLSMSVHDGYAAGYEDGREDGARVDLFLTIDYDDIQAVLDDPKREARIEPEPAMEPAPAADSGVSRTDLNRQPTVRKGTRQTGNLRF